MDDCREGSYSSGDEDVPVSPLTPGPSRSAAMLLSEMTITPPPSEVTLQAMSNDMSDIQVRLVCLETKVDSLVEMVRSVKSTLSTLTISTTASSDFHISDWSKRSSRGKFK